MTKILVIEDNPKHSFLFSDILSEEGYNVEIAETGDEANIKMNSQNESNRYDLLLIDIAIQGFNASEFIDKYKKTNRIIVVSAYADTQEVTLIIDKKWRIKKPFDTNVLLKRIKARVELPIGEIHNGE